MYDEHNERVALRSSTVLTVHSAANGDLMETLGDNSGRKGTGHPTPQSWWPRTGFLGNKHPPPKGSFMGLNFTFVMCVELKQSYATTSEIEAALLE